MALTCGLIEPLMAAEEGSLQVLAQAGAPPAGAADDRQILLQWLQQLEQRLNQVESRNGMTAAPAQTVPANLDSPFLVAHVAKMKNTGGLVACVRVIV